MSGSLDRPRHQLEAAYLATDYCVDEYPGGPFVIRIGERCPELADGEWVFVTACNPFSQQLPDEENAARMIELESDVRGRWQSYRGQGRGRDGGGAQNRAC